MATGDRIERRRLWANTALASYVTWPGMQQVAPLKRKAWRRGACRWQARLLITRQGRQISPARLLTEARGDWAIENRRHWARDVSLGQAGSQVHAGTAPRLLAGLRNTVIVLLRSAGWTNLGAALRHLALQPGTLALLVLSPREAKDPALHGVSETLAWIDHVLMCSIQQASPMPH